MSERQVFRSASVLALLAALFVFAAPLSAYAGASPSSDADFKPFKSGNDVYAQLDVDYADFFYGELKDPQENPTMELNAQDPAAALRAEGYYDAVSSATVGKAARWEQVKSDTSSGKTVATGIRKVTVRIPESLYNSAKAAQAGNAQCSNELLNIVGSLPEIATSSTIPVPDEYKTLNGDGSLTKMKTDTETAEAKAAEIVTGKRFGNYTLELNLENAPKSADIMGAILETEDGAKYGMKPMDNIFLRSDEMAFSVRSYTEPHGNTPGYQRFHDMQGKTIRRITYLLKGKKDVVIDTKLKVKTLLDDSSKITAKDNVYGKESSDVSLSFSVPSDSSYQLKSVSFKQKELAKDADYSYDSASKLLKVKTNANTGIGLYTLVFTDEKYEDIKVEFRLSSGHPDGSVRFSGNTLQLPYGITTAAYIGNISAVKVSKLDAAGKVVAGSELSFSDPKLTLGKIFFDENGKLKLDAVVPGRHNTKTVAFPDDGNYQIEITSDGYPSVKAAVSKPEKANNGGSGSGSGGSGGSGGGSGRRSGRSGGGSVTTNTAGSFKEWVQDAKGWWVRLNNGSWPASVWQRYSWNGGQYWYYFGADGYVMSGWQWINGKCYYLEPAAGKNFGHMYENTTTPDGYTVNANGEWTVNGAVQTK